MSEVYISKMTYHDKLQIYNLEHDLNSVIFF